MVVEILETLNYPAYFVTVVVIAAVLRSLRACGFSKRVRNCALLGLLGVVVYLHTLPGEPPAPPHRNYLSQQVVLSTTAVDSEGGNRTTWIEPVSWSPRAFIVHNLLSDEECNQFILAGRDEVKPSETVGGEMTRAYRTSAGAFLLRYGKGRVLAEIVERVALVVGIPVFQGERVQLLHYEVGQYYKPHTDYFVQENDRAATVLMYLSDVEEGGDTNFPQGRGTREYRQRHGEYLSQPSSCAGLEGVRQAIGGEADQGGGGPRAAKGTQTCRVRPEKGSALIFWDVGPGYNQFDMFSLHEGCAVVRGDKWSSTIWIRQDVISPWEMMDELENAARLGVIDP